MKNDSVIYFKRIFMTPMYNYEKSESIYFKRNFMTPMS